MSFQTSRRNIGTLLLLLGFRAMAWSSGGHVVISRVQWEHIKIDGPCN
jgi:hypothetical protein